MKKKKCVATKNIFGHNLQVKCVFSEYNDLHVNDTEVTVSIGCINSPNCFHHIPIWEEVEEKKVEEPKVKGAQEFNNSTYELLPVGTKVILSGHSGEVVGHTFLPSFLNGKINPKYIIRLNSSAKIDNRLVSFSIIVTDPSVVTKVS